MSISKLAVRAIDNSRSRASGDTPRSKQTRPDTIAAEKTDAIRSSVAAELKGEIFQLPFDDFIKSLLYGPPPSTTTPSYLESHPDFDPTLYAASLLQQYTADRSTALAYVEQLEADNGPGRRFAYSGDVLSLLPEPGQEPRKEKEMYAPLVDLMEDITSHYRNSVDTTELDAAWSFPNPSSDDPRPRQRHYYDISNKPPKLSRGARDSNVKPDLALMLGGPLDDMPAEYPHWKDIRVPIEIKFDGDVTNELVEQVGTYARAMKQEQFDRNFSYLLSLSDQSLRIWRWDPSCIYVSTKVDWRSSLVDLVQVIQRFGTLTPTELGYDPTFTNSGIDICTDKMPSTIRFSPSDYTGPDATALPGKPQYNFIRDSRAGPFDLEVESMIFESRDLLFNRSTRTWSAHCPADGVRRAIKQHWQDDLREPEGGLHARANGLENVADLVAFEALDSTRVIWDRVSSHINACYTIQPYKLGDRRDAPRATPVNDETPLPPICHRVLTRLLVAEVGRHLLETKTALQFMRLITCAFVGIMDLWEKRDMLHRDISLGNILISEKDPDKAFLIDFGLSQWFSGLLQQLDEEGFPHHHITGTLAYMAIRLLEVALQPGKNDPTHVLSYDIEGLFWVSVTLAFRLTKLYWSEPPNLKTMGTTEREALEAIDDALVSLEALTLKDAFKAKKAFVLSTVPPLPGRFSELVPFLDEFRGIVLKDNLPEERIPLSVDMVRVLLRKHTERIRQLECPLGAAPSVPTGGDPSLAQPGSQCTPPATPPRTPNRAATRPSTPKRSHSESFAEDKDGSPASKAAKRDHRIRTRELEAVPKSPLKPIQF